MKISKASISMWNNNEMKYEIIMKIENIKISIIIMKIIIISMKIIGESINERK